MRAAQKRRVQATLRCAVGLTAIAAIATADPAPQRSELLETLDVRVVNLEVHVSDRAGRPVEGLSARDFTVQEDGKKVDLSHFSVFEGAEGSTPAARQPGRVVLFFDSFAIQPQGRALVLEDLRAFFARGLRDGPLFAVASYDGYLRFHQNFTRDTAALLTAIEESGRLTPLGVQRQAERDAVVRQGLETLRTIRRLVDDEDRLEQAARRLRSFSQQLNAEAERQRQLTQASVFALGHLVNALAALPGRKAVVYIGEGLPMRPGEELYAAVDQVFTAIQPDLGEIQPGSEAADAEIDLRSSALESLDRGTSGAGRRGELPTSGVVELAALANSGRVSFYTLRTGSVEGGLPAEFASEMRELFTPQLQGLRESNLSESLRTLAQETGGQAVVGIDADGLLARVEADLSSYYFLGFEPRHPADGAYHRLKVKVRGRGTTLRYRSGYVDKPPVAKLADRTMAALLLGLDDNPLGVTVELAAASPGPVEDRWVVPVTVAVPLGFLEQLGATAGAVPAQLFMAARDPEGRAAPVQQMQIMLRPGEGGSRQTVEVPILLREGPQRLAFGLVVPVAGAASFVSRDLDVGAGAAG